MSIHEFKEQKTIPSTEELQKLPYTKLKDIPDYNNTEKYNWVQVGDTKYGRFMYCTKTKIKRFTTMGEFYGTGIVD